MGNEIDIVIVTDTREQEPLKFVHLPTVTGTLTSGDYSVVGLESLFSVERKSVADIVASVTSGRERFERELIRLRGYRFRRLAIIGSEDEVVEHIEKIKKRYKSKANPAGVLGSIRAFEQRYEVPVVWFATPAEAAEQIEVWAYYAVREQLRVANEITKATEKVLKS